MDIYARLREDHGKQRGLGAGLLETSGDSAERERLFRLLKNEVQAHAAAEEQTFYAELIAMSDGQERARHSIAEHKEAADLLEELSNIDMSSSAWITRYRQLHERLVHHLDEEEDEVFGRARELISGGRAKALAAEFDARKRDEA
jgi:hemerythrin superfamily protein